MNTLQEDYNESSLLLTAEECPPEKFGQFHSFSAYDDLIIRKLSAHGPVLVRGGRGSGKSALLIESNRRMRDKKEVFSVYVSLRYLPLLRSDGEEYIGHFCLLLSRAISSELKSQSCVEEFGEFSDQISIHLHSFNLWDL